MDNNLIVNDIKVEIDEDSLANFVTTNIISHDSMVTCGKCMDHMTFDEYNSKHRSLHYNLCWIDGVEEAIDFTDSSKIQDILRKYTSKYKTKFKFKCDWCDEIKLSIMGFVNHLKKCKNSPVLNLNDTSLEQSNINCSIEVCAYNDDSAVICGRCGYTTSYAEYKNNHRHKHYNLCWLDGEEKLDYSNESKMVVLLREILPKYAERNKQVSYTCEWCGIKKKSVIGYASHMKKCAIEQKFLPDESIDEIPKYDPNCTVTCGACLKSMVYSEYEKTHKSIHYNLCWIHGEDVPDLNNENVTQSLIRQSLPKIAKCKNKINFICEWCEVTKKSILGFASHVKQCKLRPDKIGLSLTEVDSKNDTIIKSEIEISKTKLESMVTCGRCQKEMTFKEYSTDHCSKHYNLCWINGEDKLDLNNYDIVLAKLKEFVPFKSIRNRSVKLICEECKIVKKSIPGFACHIIFCNKSYTDANLLLSRCDICGNKVKPSSLTIHKLKSCKGPSGIEKNEDSIYDQYYYNDYSSSLKIRRKKRLPNVLSFHPDTKYVSEYYDCICRLCNFNTLSIVDIFNHILIVHNIDINNTNSGLNLKDYILNTYDLHTDIYLKKLLNYYNFFKKTFWIINYHEDFQPNIILVNNNDALKYLPTVQESCKIFNLNNEEISVDLFKSVYVNGMHWLFTGGPNWAMSWCPVPEEIQTQYLAIACHPKPDLVHKEMEIYKYPSLVQLWTFNSLNNIIVDSVYDTPYMSYGLAHEFGAVWDMAWCPSGAYEPNKKVGLLALSTSCGDCPIFAMPFVNGNSKMFYIYKAKSIIARNFECDWFEGGVQCTKVCWKAVKPFNTLICGYSNGMVSIFNISFKSIFLNNDVLYPSHTFRASRCSITGLSVNYLNSSILATTATDGNIILWDLKSTENPVFQKKSYYPSDCAWLQQCYTLVYCSKGVTPSILKVRTINFSNYDDDFSGYNPELYVLKNVVSNNVISNYVVNNEKKFNFDDANENISKIDDESSTLNESNENRDDESLKSIESNTNSDEEKSDSEIQSGDALKNIDDDDLYGPSFFQKNTHWSVSGSNWTNIIATGDENGVIYEKLFFPEINQFRKINFPTPKLMVRKLSSNNIDQLECLNCCHFKETIKEFGLESGYFNSDEYIKNNHDDSKPLLRYPLDNITKVSWNQNFSSFRWLAIGTQSGFTLLSPSQAISDNCIELFYKTISANDFDSVGCNQTENYD